MKNKWLEYEERKKLIQAKNLTTSQYQKALQQLLRELGL